MCDICKDSRLAIEEFIKNEMMDNAKEHGDVYRPSDDVRVIIDILCRKFYKQNALELLVPIMTAAVDLWAEQQAQFEAEEAAKEGIKPGTFISPMPKSVN